MVKEKIGVLGLGLIGGSIALRLKERYDVVGVARKAEVRAAAEAAGITTAASETAFVGCKAVFVCVPVTSTVACIRRVYDAVGDSAILTDVAGIKGILSDLHLPRLVGGHPMAGTEHSGFAAAKPHLFENAYYPIVPFDASEADVRAVESLVEVLGARPVRIDADTHDRYVAEISHTPHVLAYALAALPEGALGVAGTGFYDMTRIARSDPAFWSEIVLGNRNNVLSALDGVEANIAAMRRAVEAGDGETLTRLFAAGQAKRVRLEEDKLNLGEYVLYVDVVDRPGEVERVSSVLSAAKLNVKSLAIVHSREGVGGALRLGFASASDRNMAEQLLKP